MLATYWKHFYESYLRNGIIILTVTQKLWGFPTGHIYDFRRAVSSQFLVCICSVENTSSFRDNWAFLILHKANSTARTFYDTYCHYGYGRQSGCFRQKTQDSYTTRKGLIFHLSRVLFRFSTEYIWMKIWLDFNLSFEYIFPVGNHHTLKVRIKIKDPYKSITVMLARCEQTMPEANLVAFVFCSSISRREQNDSYLSGDRFSPCTFTPR